MTLIVVILPVDLQDLEHRDKVRKELGKWRNQTLSILGW